MTVRLALPLLLAVATGCGSDDVPAPRLVRAPVHVVTPTSAPGTPTVRPADPEPPVTVYFTSPSGRIGCSVSAKSAVCEVPGHRWAMPPQPADCEFDWGGMVEVAGRRPGAHVCHSDTVFGAGPLPVLGYGASRGVGSFRCTSARTGMTCVNVTTRHGFTVSRAAFRLF